MLPEDREKLKELMISYPAKILMKELGELMLDVAGDLSDVGSKDMAKSYTHLGSTLKDIVVGRPFLM